MDLNLLDRRHIERVHGTIFLCFTLVVCLAATFAEGHTTNRSDATDADDKGTVPDTLEWRRNYAAAYAEAKRERKMLLVEFVPDDGSGLERQLDGYIDKDESLKRRMRLMVLARLPHDYESDVPGIKGALVKHSAFKHLSGQTGIVIIDLRDPDAPYYGKVVTALPFSRGKYYHWQPSELKVALELPPGTITQRTMIWAVRIHPESPASTTGTLNPALAEAATQHSGYQARIQVQGHQGWESRFHQVRSAANANDAKEVVAESWPNENLIDSCIDCVDSWRHSPGHWNAVRGRHRLFGYDIRSGRNGIWYGTGIFAD